MSLAKDRIPVLLLEGVSGTAVQAFAGAGRNLVRLPKALNGEALTAPLKGERLLGIRSPTRSTSPENQKGPRC
jgi:D-3-phosphoglycerate dehydrogenase / 2-oxoglutarate reductase